jgi:hypothetical protein
VFSNKNIDNGNYSETKDFEVKTIAGQNLMSFQVPLIYAKNNPDSESKATSLFIGEYKGLLYDGSYWAKGIPAVIDSSEAQKLGNKNLLNAYLQATGGPAFPYDK